MTSAGIHEPGQLESTSTVEEFATVLTSKLTEAEQGQLVLEDLRKLVKQLKTTDDESDDAVTPEATPERPWSDQLLDVVIEFKDSDIHRLLMNETMAALSSRLETAGFLRRAHVSNSVEVLPSLGRYVAWTRRTWTHPDCDVPFFVDLTVHVHTSGDQCGKVYADLEMIDQVTGDESTGVLTGHMFLQQVELQPSVNLCTASFFRFWVSQGMSKLTPDTFSSVFDDAVRHLDRVTTP
jgi:hypothetical protein